MKLNRRSFFKSIAASFLIPTLLKLDQPAKFKTVKYEDYKDPIELIDLKIYGIQVEMKDWKNLGRNTYFSMSRGWKPPERVAS